MSQFRFLFLKAYIKKHLVTEKSSFSIASMYLSKATVKFTIISLLIGMG